MPANSQDLHLQLKVRDGRNRLQKKNLLWRGRLLGQSRSPIAIRFLMQEIAFSEVFREPPYLHCSVQSQLSISKWSNLHLHYTSFPHNFLRLPPAHSIFKFSLLWPGITIEKICIFTQSALFYKSLSFSKWLLPWKWGGSFVTGTYFATTSLQGTHVSYLPLFFRLCHKPP